MKKMQPWWTILRHGIENSLQEKLKKKIETEPDRILALTIITFRFQKIAYGPLAHAWTTSHFFKERNWQNKTNKQQCKTI